MKGANPFGVHGIDPDAVVLHQETLLSALFRPRGVREEPPGAMNSNALEMSLENLSELGRIGGDRRERARRDLGVLSLMTVRATKKCRR